jgi:hypothetical protein
MSAAVMKGTFGCVAVVAWLALFAAGLLVDSGPYRKVLESVGTADLSGASVFTAFAAAACLYTPVSVAFLTLLAGFIGGCASNMTYGGATPSGPQTLKELFRTENPLASMLRSFLVYLTFISGIYITTTDPFAKPTADQYVRFAGTISLLAFVVGYDPTKFQQLVDLASQRQPAKP